MKSSNSKWGSMAMLIVILAALLLLSACGAPKTVPDKTIEWAVEDFMKSTFEPLGLNPGCTYSVAHTADSATKSDTIHIDLALDDTHFNGTSSYDATYVYDKSSGLWSVARGGEWSGVTIDQYKNVDLKKDTVIGAFEKNGFVIERESIIEGTQEDMSPDYLPEGVICNSAWTYIPSSDDLILVQLLLEGENAGAKTYDAIREELKGLFQDEIAYGSEIEENQVKGNNYEITIMHAIQDGMVINARYGYVENDIIVFAMFKELETIANSDKWMNKTMADLGLPLL